MTMILFLPPIENHLIGPLYVFQGCRWECFDCKFQQPYNIGRRETDAGFPILYNLLRELIYVSEVRLT